MSWQKLKYQCASHRNENHLLGCALSITFCEGCGDPIKSVYIWVH